VSLWLLQLSSLLSDICGGILFTAEGCNNTSKLDWMQQPAKAKGFLVVTTGFFCQFFGWDWKLSINPCGPFSQLCGLLYGITVQPQYLMASPTSSRGF
jgi:hypothetical protein